MDTHSAARRNCTLVVLMGGLVLVAGLGAASLHPAFADDDNWHTEADRPLSLQQQLMDRDEILASIAAPPAREVVYGPSSTLPITPPLQYIESSYQTADVEHQR